jgi:hypothetical protein
VGFSLCRPQPYSSRHDAFLQRYVQSGQPHILNSVRAVVALHKDRHAFPISLCVARLSGMGADALFIGVMRHEPASGTADHQLFKVGNNVLETCGTGARQQTCMHGPCLCTCLDSTAITL